MARVDSSSRDAPLFAHPALRGRRNTTTAGSGFRTVAPAAPETSTFNASCFVVPRLVTFSAPDGTQIHGQVFDPEDAPPDCGIALTAKVRDGATRPGVVFTHGGCQRQMYAVCKLLAGASCTLHVWDGKVACCVRRRREGGGGCVCAAWHL